ncbi:MAG: cell division protein PerM [Canibacter sp.]
MKPIVTSLISALVGAALVVIGVLIVAVPAILMWMISFQLAGDPFTFAGGVTGVWLLGHGVPLEFHFSAEEALGFGAAAEAVSLPLSLPLLGLTVVTVIGGVQAGWRAMANERWSIPVLVASLIGFGVLTTVAFGFAQPIVNAPTWYAIGRPVLMYTLALVGGALARGLVQLNFWARFVDAPLRTAGKASASGWISASLRLAGAGIAAVIVIASLGVAVSLALHFTQIIAMSQSLHLDWIGALLVALVQILLLPVAIIWGIAWLSGAGFAIGAGSSIGPFEQLVGPVPAFPMLGALPDSWGGGGLLAPLLLVVVVLVLAAWVGSRRPWNEMRWWQAALAATCAGVAVGAVIELCVGFARGSIGPGRLIVTGPEPWTTGILIAAEVTFGFVVGVLVRRLDQYWVNPLTEAVKSRRSQARTSREQEWAQLGKPETFTKDLRRRSSREEEHELVSEFDTIEYHTAEYDTAGFDTADDGATEATTSQHDRSEDEHDTGAVITDAFDFQREKFETGDVQTAVDEREDAENGEHQVADELSDFDTDKFAREDLDRTGWFEDFAVGDAPSEELIDESEIETIDERPRDSSEPEDLMDPDPDLTDPDAIARAFAWDAGQSSTDLHVGKSEQSEAPKPKLSRWLRRKK